MLFNETSLKHKQADRFGWCISLQIIVTFVAAWVFSLGRCARGVHSDEVAHGELPHLDLCSLQIQLYVFLFVVL